MNVEKLLQAAKAEMIPEGWSGLWYVQKITVSKPLPRDDGMGILPADTYTHLFRLTDSTMHLNQPGEVVMEDTPFELRTHLQFMLKAHGNVLVTGLGLGCVVRGLLANPGVKHVTCIENSKDVLRLVEPYMPKNRLTIVEDDALAWTEENDQKFDCAWHDLWTDRDAGEPHLDFWHTRLILNCRNEISYQGAWKYSRRVKTILTRGLRPPISLIA